MKQKTFIETGVLFHVIASGEDFHSFRNLNLILAPFTYKPAEPKENYIDIPGGDGSLDLTEALGDIKYNDRNFEFKFTVFPPDNMTFEERQSFISAALNGKRCRITLDRDCDYYWEGRVKVNGYLCDKNLKQIVITARVAPYKMMQNETVVSVEATTAGETVILTNGRKKVVPVITCTGETVIEFGGVSYSLPAGTHKVLNIVLVEDANPLKVSGSGTVTFTYREGAL